MGAPEPTLAELESQLIEVIQDRPAFKRSVKSTPDCPDLIARNVLSTDEHNVGVMRSVDAYCAKKGCGREAAIVSVLPMAIS